MSVAEEIQATELKLLQEYIDIIMNMLEAILEDKPTSYEYLTELSQRITTQLQEQYPDYIFYVGKKKFNSFLHAYGYTYKPQLNLLNF